ncbi:MAG: succinate--CoA ligase subunit beta [Thermofilum sp. ex4484_79]|nr:MAG: succinate--CoA ligase subunit beta [Thermofilum sp. ex4484_79]
MYLYEYEALELLRKYNIPVEKSCLARNLKELKECSRIIPPPNVLKAQVLTGMRGKAGGIIFTETLEDFEKSGKALFQKRINNSKVNAILVSERVDIRREMYIALTYDRTLRKFTLISSPLGGMDIEEIAIKNPKYILKVSLEPLIETPDFVIRAVAKHLDIPFQEMKKLVEAMYNLFIENKCELVEINPLVLTSSGEILAIDRKIVLDDVYVRINPSLRNLLEKRLREMGESERIAFEYGFSYVRLEGNIAVIGNGAGLTMASMDLVHLYGGKPGIFLDLGGGASSQRVEKALSLVLQDPQIDRVFINILGGITRCDEVATGIANVLKNASNKKKLFVRLLGNNEELGRKILSEVGIPVFTDLKEAVKKAVKGG